MPTTSARSPPIAATKAAGAAPVRPVASVAPFASMSFSSLPLTINRSGPDIATASSPNDEPRTTGAPDGSIDGTS
jgi:hypothetical protein